jgi:cellulose biosynthesis protein BcsQ
MNPSEIERFRRRIIVVYSPEGGNGKSEIAANLAYCLAKRGLRTWILDANIFAPTQDLIFQFRVPGATLSEFLLDPYPCDLPLYDLTEHLNPRLGIPVYLTPSCRENSDIRFRLQQAMIHGEDIYSKIPLAIFETFLARHIDILIIDTHPSFGELNEVWLGMTEFLLIISRMNDLDLENLKPLLNEGMVLDVTKKLVVFNNVNLDEEGHAQEAMKNTIALQRFQGGVLERDAIPDQKARQGLEFYSEPFLYSKKLAMYGESVARSGLFVEKEPSDSFSRGIKGLSAYLLTQPVFRK